MHNFIIYWINNWKISCIFFWWWKGYEYSTYSQPYHKKVITLTKPKKVFPDGLDNKKSACNAGDPGLIPGLGRFPRRREWLPTPGFLSREFHGRRRLVGYSPWGCKQSDTTQRPTHTSQIREILIEFYNFWPSESLQCKLITCNIRDTMLFTIHMGFS